MCVVILLMVEARSDAGRGRGEGMEEQAKEERVSPVGRKAEGGKHERRSFRHARKRPRGQLSVTASPLLKVFAWEGGRVEGGSGR